MRSTVPPHPSPAALQAGRSRSTRHRWLPAGGEGLRYRAGVAVRVLAAIFGGYAVSGLAAAVLAVLLPTTRVEAAVTGTLVALAVYPCAVMWVFAARSAWSAWRGLLVTAAVMGAVLAAHFYFPGAVA